MAVHYNNKSLLTLGQFYEISARFNIAEKGQGLYSQHIIFFLTYELAELASVTLE